MIDLGSVQQIASIDIYLGRPDGLLDAAAPRSGVFDAHRVDVAGERERGPVVVVQGHR